MGHWSWRTQKTKHEICSTRGNGDVRAQELLDIGDTEDGTQMMKTQNMNLGTQGI